ncbi:oxygen-insensitive NAD(P)H nitroreductase [Sulfuricystis thermophila]|uniref:oxygen-insensitive NAD(P)H nitroreductase n=1 Tax=Sulfuricystis thermophila TaxID=2496847 RepID=UPI0010366269|nr:oxygen-insensitive NAD(P)H nitroreductase [Sulfuricystis thermophila]
MDIAQIAQTRHTCKAYDPKRKIPSEQVEQLKTLLRFAPSSVNSQPWHFIIAASEAAKANIAKATEHPVFSANGPKIRDASHVVVFCARTTLDDAHLVAVTDQEARDGRFPNPDAQAAQLKSRRFYAGLHRFDLKDTQHWMEKQVYLALGTLLFAAAALGIDATPIEGFDSRILNEVLGLREKGLTSVVLAALGYRSAEDFNARLPKSRLPTATVITEL